MYNNKAAHIALTYPYFHPVQCSQETAFVTINTITSSSGPGQSPFHFPGMQMFLTVLIRCTYAPAIIIREIIEDTIFCNYQQLFKNSNVIEKLSFLLLSTSVVGGRWMDLLLHGATYAFYKFTFREIDKIKIRNSNRNIILLRIKPIPNTTSSSAKSDFKQFHILRKSFLCRYSSTLVQPFRNVVFWSWSHVTLDALFYILNTVSWLSLSLLPSAYPVSTLDLCTL